VHIRSWNILRLLAERYEVEALCFYRRAVQRNLATSLEALRRLGRAEAFPIPQEHSRARLLADHLRSLATGRVYTEFVHESADYRGALSTALHDRRPDLVHVDSLDLSGLLPMLEGLPVACTHHNVESLLLARRARLERGVRGAYLAHQAALMERAERRWCPRVALNVCVSADDAAALDGFAPGGRYVVIPNGVDVDTFTPGGGRGEGIVFVGGTTWFPNRDGLAHFAEDILPLVRRRLPDVPVTWVGRCTAEERRLYGERDGIRMTGYVEDIRPYVHAASCYVVPLRVGGGTRLKILDAWAMGMPVVSTPAGCEGLIARDGENIISRADPAEFADAVCAVLEDADLRGRLGRAARETAEVEYSWQVIGRRLHSAYDALRSA
jgi:glycosyltransferase involved in cell wall biosynthesis